MLQLESILYTKDISILPEDFEKSSKDYWTDNCPLGIAFKRQFPEYKETDLSICVGTIYLKYKGSSVIALLEKPFRLEDFEKLRGKEEPFHTKVFISLG